MMIGFRAKPRRTMMQAITATGLTSGLQLCLDAGDSASYTSGQSWLDRSGNGYDFFLGANNSADATDPTFNGTAGRLSSSEYFSVDGGDRFTYDTTNETWMQNLHKDNAVFTLACWARIGSHSAANGLCGTLGTSGNTGAVFNTNTSGQLQLQVRNAGASAFNQTSPNSYIPVDTWTLAAVSMNEAGGVGGVRWYANGQSDASDDATYSSPASGNATNTLVLCGGGSTASPLLTGGRMAAFMAWNTALSLAQLNALFNATRGRFGV